MEPDPSGNNSTTTTTIEIGDYRTYLTLMRTQFMMMTDKWTK